MDVRTLRASRRLAPVFLCTCVLLAACGERQDAARTTAVMGGAAALEAASAPLRDAQGRAIPLPPLPRGTEAQLVRAGPDLALALWVQDGHAVAATHTTASGWTTGQPLEQIFGEASDARLASNGRGVAVAVWRHTVGNIESLRFSHWQAQTGWSTPDVMPGALPRPRSAGPDAAPQLEMDSSGRAVARWASGFAAGERQSARFTPEAGWSRADSEPLGAAPTGRAASGEVR